MGYTQRIQKNKRKIKKKTYKIRLIKGGNAETAAVCAIMLKEQPYVDEWIQYYIYGLGFTHAFIYDNSDDNSLKDLSNKYPGKVTIRHFPGKVKQLPAYNDFLVKNRTDPNKYTWCAFFDCDEFLVLKEQTNVIDFLKKYCKEGGVCINWYLFGDSNLKTYKPEPVTKRFIMRQNKIDQHVKTIIKCDDVDNISDLHGIKGFKPGKNKKDTNGKIVDGPFNQSGPDNIAVINHYIIKTREEHDTKRGRGRANTNNVKHLRTAESFNSQNHNEVTDTAASIIYDRAHKEYSLTQIKGGSNNLKVAIIFSGRIKGYENVKDKVLHIKNKYNATVFCSLNKKNKSEYINNFCNTFDIRDHQLNLELTNTPEWIMKLDKREETSYEGTYSMFYHTRKAFDLITTYQQSNKMHFDCVIFFRADIDGEDELSIKAPNDNTIYIPEGEDYGGICGIIAYGSYKSMDKYSNLVNCIDYICKKQNVVYHPETMLKQHLLNESLVIERFPYKYKLHHSRKEHNPAYNNIE
jgi:hypothetical protein